jgi:hypothetical protein
MQDERAALFHLHQFGQILLRLLRIDVGSGVISEHAEVAIDPQVDGGGLERTFPERLDHDAAALELLAYGLVREDHDRSLSLAHDSLPVA